MISVGFGVEVVNVPPGTPMAGFAARYSGSTGTLDPTTARAVILGGAAIVAIDVCALHEETCRSVREGVAGLVDGCIVTATHTHSGPCSARGRLGPAIPRLEEQIVQASVAAIHQASLNAVPCTVDIRSARSLGIAYDRRRGRASDPALSVLTARRPEGPVQGYIAHFACHPVVIDGSNTLISGDYPAALRHELERGGGTAVFLTGCAGDINTGHSAESSYAPTGLATRTPAEAGRIGERLARAAKAAAPRPLELSSPRVAARDIVLPLNAPVRETVVADRTAWLLDHENAVPARRALLETWIAWADAILATPDDTNPGTPSPSWTGRVSALHLGDLIIAALPGEPFLATADRLEAAIAAAGFTGTSLVLGYADGVPGYLPPRNAYPEGGYEVSDAHRYYAMEGPFAAGAVELLEEAVLDTVRQVSAASAP